MNREELDPIQSYIEYTHKERNSTNKINTTKPSSEDAFYKKLKEINDKKEEEKKAAERLQTAFQLNDFTRDLNKRIFDTQINRSWDQMPGSTREEIRFKMALNPTPTSAKPKDVSYEEAKEVFDEYDYYTNNPITWREFQKKTKKDISRLTFKEPKSFDDYVVFIDPETTGYIRPKGDNTEFDKSIYNVRLSKSIAEYQKSNIDLDALTDNTWDSYLKDYRINPYIEDDFYAATSDLLDWAPSELRGLTEIGKKTLEGLEEIEETRKGYYYKNELNKINLNLYNEYADSHGGTTRPASKSDLLDPIINTSNVTNRILKQFPKDNNGNILINGESFPEYFVYKQIFNSAAGKFESSLLKDFEESKFGLGKAYMDDIYIKQYGKPYDEYIQEVLYSRVKEIRGRIVELGEEMVDEEAPAFSNNIQSGFSRMGVMLPSGVQEWIADKTAEAVKEHPFTNAVEEIDAYLSDIEGGEFLKGLDSGLDAINIFTLGVSGVVADLDKLSVLKKVKDNKSLSLSEQRIFELIKLEDELKGLYKELNIKKPLLAEIGSGVGQFISDMPMFAMSMGATSFIGENIKYGTDFALKKAIKQKTFNSAMNLAKQGTIDVSKMYAVNFARGAATAPFMSITYKSYVNKELNQYSFDENGNLKFNPKSKWAMAVGAFLEGANEISSEYWGGTFDDVISLGSKAFGRATGISKWLNKTEAGAWLRRAAQSPMSAATKKALRNLGYTGILSEPLSEVWGDLMTNTELMFLDNTVNLVKDGKNFEWKKEGRSFDTDYSFAQFKNPDYWITIMGVSTISGGAMTSVAAGGNILTQAKYAKQLVNNKNKALNEIKNEELKNTLRLLGDSENFVNAAIELANFDWKGKGISLADKTNAINYIKNSYTLQTTMGDMEGQRHMMSFEDIVDYYKNREFTSGGEHNGYIYTAFDAQGNTYNLLNVEETAEDGSIKSYRVIDDAGNISIKLNSELFGIQEELIDNIIAEEYSNTFSSEIESTRLNNVRQTFERISNPTEVDIRRLTSEFGIRKPEVGKTVKLVDVTEATIKEDLKNGNYIIERYNPETTEKEDIEIPVYNILSNNPITAAAQKKMFEDAKAVQESGNPSIVPESHKSSEDKVNDIINVDYDSKLFDERGTVKLNEEQVISTFSTEDPNILGDYIKKVGNRVSPQVKKALDNALELSKKHNEINSHISNAYQHNTTRSDVADLVNTLNNVIRSASPQMTTEEIITSITDNPNTQSAIREDFSNILKSIKGNYESKQSTTKTKTSITQKDVKGKRGRKQIEKGIKDLRKGLKDNNPTETLNAINRIDENLSKVEDEPITSREKQFVEETRKTLKEQGYEIQPMRGMNYHSGLKATVEFEINPELPAGAQIVKNVKKPQINKDGVMVQAAEIVVEQGPTIEEETPDISQAVTKEMTGEEPMDFSEPTDDPVEPKKEDRSTQDYSDSIIPIPNLDNVFQKADTESMIETPSREEEIETLTDEQRNQVRIHDENGTDLVDPISDSALPDDPSTDEVIVDKHELQGNRIYRYDGEQLRNNQTQVRRIPNKEGDNHDLVYKWLDENSIDLQGIIDNELAAIAALDINVKFMMMTEGTKSGYDVGSPMLNTIFQVVEYTNAIKKIHNEKRGGVITSNGKEYLLIGITGFRTFKPGIFNPENAHYSFIADKVLKSARNSYTSQTNEISRDAYYVHPTMSTKIKNIEAGWIVTQTTEDSGKQNRSLGELIADETRNPYGITAENSKWLIPTRNSAKPIKVRVDANDIVHKVKVHTGLAGSLFLLVPAANGHYIPISVKIQTINKLANGNLKNAIWEVAQNLLSTEKEVRDYAIKELCKLLNLTKEGYNILIEDKDIDFDNPNNAKIVFYKNGKRTGTEVSLSSPNKTDELYDAIFSTPFQLNIGLQTLVSGELQAYIDAGALITDVALLGTTNASYTIHSIGPDLKEDPYAENSTESQEGSYESSDLRRAQDNGIINYGNNSYSVVAEGQYRNTITGELVTSAKRIREIETHIWLEESKPTPVKIEQDSKAKLYIIGENEVISVSKKGIITFYSEERSIDIIDEINRENIEESRINNAVEELARIEEQQQAEQVIPQELQEEEEVSVPEVNFTENFDVFDTPEVSPVEDSFTEVSFEETSIPKEKVSATFTEGVVENSDLNQLSTVEYLSTIEKQLKAEGFSEDTIDSITDKAYNQLTELGLNSYYSKDQESLIKTIVDKIKECG